MTHQQELSDIIRLELLATFKYLSMLGACLPEGNYWCLVKNL